MTLYETHLADSDQTIRWVGVVLHESVRSVVTHCGQVYNKSFLEKYDRGRVAPDIRGVTCKRCLRSHQAEKQRQIVRATLVSPEPALTNSQFLGRVSKVVFGHEALIELAREALDWDGVFKVSDLASSYGQSQSTTILRRLVLLGMVEQLPKARNGRIYYQVVEDSPWCDFIDYCWELTHDICEERAEAYQFPEEREELPWEHLHLLAQRIGRPICGRFADTFQFWVWVSALNEPWVSYEPFCNLSRIAGTNTQFALMPKLCQLGMLEDVRCTDVDKQYEDRPRCAGYPAFWRMTDSPLWNICLALRQTVLTNSEPMLRSR